jgi:hypothetical protein
MRARCRDRSVTNSAIVSGSLLVVTSRGARNSALARVRDQFWPSRRGHHFDEICRG